jgi:NhaA family Na+:H+ antiporter
MTIFFLVVALEIRRELAGGELADRRRAALPLFGAVGGIAVPALIFLAFNAGTPAVRGWAIPTATDIAFVAGALAVVGARVPDSLKVFLLALAIADDIAAIAIIAIFYTGDFNVAALLIAVLLIAALVVLRSRSVSSLTPYLVVGAALWMSFLAAGIHATLAGVVLAGLLPANAPRRSPVERLENSLNEWSSLAIVPLFALANVGVDLPKLPFGSVLDSKVTMGVAIGLVVGKSAGVALGAGLASRLRVARLPADIRCPQFIGAATLSGIGFTVSLFVAGLSFGPQLFDEARIGILLGSVVSFAVGVLILQRAK